MLETAVRACQSTYVCRPPLLARRPPTTPINGVAQELSMTQSGAGQLLKGILVRDWPLIIRLSDE